MSQLVDRFRVLHERIIVLSVITDDVAYVSRSQRGTLRELSDDIYFATLHFGFMEIQDVPKNLARLVRREKFPTDEASFTYFLRREHIVAGAGGEMGQFAESIFAFMHRNATSADSYFCLPPERVVELGWQLDL
jgi:KUP system potassium uptake protein